MRTDIVCVMFTLLAEGHESRFNDYARAHPILGHVVAIPVATATNILLGMRATLLTVEAVALTAINLIGASLSEKCTLKDAKDSFIRSLNLGWRHLLLPLACTQVFVKIVYNPVAFNLKDYLSCDNSSKRKA